ncbi:hypothetical protein QFC19_004017 [Naganishia cerealis]|uniref:Uncharacterized protein n=1 Tax=Naganishia cerealis TaxID=610337 RepID=A0ACC2VXJ6_9TREE|nr:hypothetical protein QFC19_004017 [Naganishia cerealis]
MAPQISDCSTLATQTAKKGGQAQEGDGSGAETDNDESDYEYVDEEDDEDDGEEDRSEQKEEGAGQKRKGKALKDKQQTKKKHRRIQTRVEPPVEDSEVEEQAKEPVATGKKTSASAISGLEQTYSVKATRSVPSILRLQQDFALFHNLIVRTNYLGEMTTTSDSLLPASRLPLPTSPRISRIPQPASKAIIRPISLHVDGRSSSQPRQLKGRTINPSSPAAVSSASIRNGASTPVSLLKKPSVSSIHGQVLNSTSGTKATARPTIPTSSTPSRLRNPISTPQTQSPARPVSASVRGDPSANSLPPGKTSAQELNPPKSPSRVSIREQIAAKRRALLAASGSLEERGGPSDGAAKEARRQRSTMALERSMSDFSMDEPQRRITTPQGSADIFGRTIPTLIRKAMTTGRLDVANMSLERLPKEVWTKILNLSGDDLPHYDQEATLLAPSHIGAFSVEEEAMELPPHELERRRMLEADEIMNVPFYEVQDIVLIKASSNSLKSIEAQIAILTRLLSSDNLIAAFPACLILSPSLHTVDLSRNSISSISWENPVRPNREILQSRKDNSFFDSFPSTPTKSDFRDDDTDEVMPSLKTLCLAKNKITNFGLPQTWPRNLEVIDLSDNNLQGVLDLTVLAALPRLKRVTLSGNGLTGVVVQAEGGRALWPSLETINLKMNEIRMENTLIQSLRLDRPYTTAFGSADRGTVHILKKCLFPKILEENPLKYSTVKKVHPATVAQSALTSHHDKHLSTETLQSANVAPSNRYEGQPAGPLVGCWDERQQSVVVTRDAPTLFLDDEGCFDSQYVLDAVPTEAYLKIIDFSGILKLRTLIMPANYSRLANVTTLSITYTSLRTEDETLLQLSKAMPNLEILDLSGSRIEHLNGAGMLIANGLKRLLAKGCRIADISSLVDVASELHRGSWRGNMRLEEVDIRDNSVEKVCVETTIFRDRTTYA